jgi:hypothetical protein
MPLILLSLWRISVGRSKSLKWIVGLPAKEDMEPTTLNDKLRHGPNHKGSVNSR